MDKKEKENNEEKLNTLDIDKSELEKAIENMSSSVLMRDPKDSKKPVQVLPEVSQDFSTKSRLPKRTEEKGDEKKQAPRLESTAWSVPRQTEDNKDKGEYSVEPPKCLSKLPIKLTMEVPL
jgi:hypothetical protein